MEVYHFHNVRAGEPRHEAVARSAGQDAVFGKRLPANFASVLSELLTEALTRPDNSRTVRGTSSHAPTRLPTVTSTACSTHTRRDVLGMK